MRILSLLWVYFMVLVSEGIVLVPTPVNLTVSSDNFIHILQWSPGKGTQPGTVYTVKIINNPAHIISNISGTSTDISEYMKNKYVGYNIQLWASFGNGSSSTADTYFTPYTSTIIGPPILSLTGCGDSLNISIDLPNRRVASDNFYNAISFDIEWTKARDEKDDCSNEHTNYQSKRSVQSYSYVLRYLEPGERYCVKAKPKGSSIYVSLSSCFCEFTSRIEPRGVAFLAGWVVGSVLVGFCFLSFIFSLVYTGFLCNRNIRLPKALIAVVPGYFFSAEETSVSVAEVEYGVQIHKPKDHEQEKTGNGLFKQNDDDDDVDYDEESYRDYMDRGVLSESESTGSTRSDSVSGAAENPGACSFEDTPTTGSETPLSLSRLRDGRLGGCDQAASLDSVTINFKALNAAEGRTSGGQMKEEGREEEDSGNVNLWSVVLKSMQQEDEEFNEPSDAEAPHLPLLLKEDSLTLAKTQTGSSSELHTALQKDSDGVCERVQTGYMASHAGDIGTENCSSEDEEEDHTSAYMTR